MNEQLPLFDTSPFPMTFKYKVVKKKEVVFLTNDFNLASRWAAHFKCEVKANLRIVK